MRVFALCGLVAAASAMSSANDYPLFKQCDPRWGSLEMGVDGQGERATICKEGCAMSCVSMALRGINVPVGGNPVDPGALNAWLISNDGYECIDGDCNNLKLDIIYQASGGRVKFVSEAPKPALKDIETNIASGDLVYIAHVDNNSHFVLLAGVDSSGNLLVNDPYYNLTTYPYNNVTDIITYSIGTPPPMLQVDDLPSTAVVPFQYPTYKQCDPRWGNDIIETTTVCKVGCLMSSISMAIHEKNIMIASNYSDPGTLNSWLRNNHGYTQDNDLIESVVPNINPSHIKWPSDGMHTSNDLSHEEIQAMLKAGRPVIANVLQGTHFVLVVGWDTANSDTLYVNDPGFDRTTYSYSTVVGWRLFDMTSVSQLFLRGSR